MAICAPLSKKKRRRKMELSIVKGQKVNYQGKSWIVEAILKRGHGNYDGHIQRDPILYENIPFQFAIAV